MRCPERRPNPRSSSPWGEQPRNRAQTYTWWRVLPSSTDRATCREYSSCRSRTRTDAGTAAAALDAAAPSSTTLLQRLSAESERTGVRSSWPPSLQYREDDPCLKIGAAVPGSKVEAHPADLKFPRE